MILQGDINFYYGYPGDITLNGAKIYRDPGLETAVLISLFTDRRADDGDPLPDNNDDLRGWWADAISGRPIGSKLWLLERAKLNNTTLANMEQYINDALGWMESDGIVDNLETTAEKTGINEAKATTTIKKEGLEISFRFFYNWKYQIFRSI